MTTTISHSGLNPVLNPSLRSESAEAREWLIPTTTRERTADLRIILAQVVCLCTLGDASERAALIFALAMRYAQTLYVPAGTRMISPRDSNDLSGIDLKSGRYRMGRPHAVAAWLEMQGGTVGARTLHRLALRSTHDVLLIADSRRDLGLIDLSLDFKPDPE